MVNLCSVTGCIARYSKEHVKLHRYPLNNKETLPYWIAATKKKKPWTPNKSARMCDKHFEESAFFIHNDELMLRQNAVPTVDYNVDILFESVEQARPFPENEEILCFDDDLETEDIPKILRLVEEPSNGENNLYRTIRCYF